MLGAFWRAWEFSLYTFKRIWPKEMSVSAEENSEILLESPSHQARSWHGAQPLGLLG